MSIEKIVINGGDLGKLTPEERGKYYIEVCNSVGVNPLTEPFKFIVLNGKLQMYATKACAEQLRKIHNISLMLTEGKQVGDAYIVKAKALMPNGRTDESSGAVSLTGLKGEAFSNALMKAETKAKRRVTLSICGLGYLDETEVEDIPNAVLVTPDVEINVEAQKQPAKTPESAVEAQKPPAEGAKESKKDEESPPTEPPKEEKKRSSKKKPPTITATVVVMEKPVQTEGGFELKVLITEPRDLADDQTRPLTIMSPELYEEGQALVVTGVIENDTFAAESVTPVAAPQDEAKKYSVETVQLRSDPKTNTFEVNGQKQKLPWAYVEARDGGEYAIVGECVSEFKSGDTLEVAVTSEQTKGRGTLLFIEKATQVAQAS